MWALCGMCGRGTRGSGGGWGYSFDTLGSETIRGCRTFIEMDVKNKERCMYFVCDFNGRWLKNLNLLCCIIIILSEEGKVVDIIQVGCFIELIIFYFF